jgi:hypothetical protein
MTTEVLAATGIANLNAIPPQNNTASTGGSGVSHSVDGYVAPTTGYLAGSVYQFVRLPSACYLKELKIKLDASVTTFAGNIGLYYSNSTTDGTTAAHQGTALSASLFASAQDLHAQNTAWLDLTALLPAADFEQPLWQVAGLTSDPHTPFDVTIVTTSTTSGSPIVLCRASFVSDP